MTQYMVQLDLPETLTQEFLSLIPTHRSKVNELMTQGKIFSYSLAADRTKIWAVLLAPSELEAMETLGELPLMRFMNIGEVSALAFHNSISLSMPQFSLN